MPDEGVPESESDHRDSGPFCQHWSDPSDCDHVCARPTCGHRCPSHYYGDCRECDCPEFVNED